MFPFCKFKSGELNDLQVGRGQWLSRAWCFGSRCAFVRYLPPDVNEEPETAAGGSLRDPGEKSTTPNAEHGDRAEKKEDGKGKRGVFSKCVCM